MLFRRQRLGVLLLILADVAFTLSLIFTYLYLRGLNTESGWIPADGGTTAPVSVGWVIAAVMVLSLLAYSGARRGIANGHPSRLMVGTVLALGLVLVDLVLQVYQLATMPMHSWRASTRAATVGVRCAGRLPRGAPSDHRVRRRWRCGTGPGSGSTAPTTTTR